MEMFEHATHLHIEGRHEEAEQLYDQLLSQNHDNSGLLATVGTLYLAMGKPGLAITLLEYSLKTSQHGRASDVLSNLGLAYKHSGLRDRAEKYMREACNESMSPSAEAMTNYGALFIESEHRDVGSKFLKKAIDAKPDLALAHWNYALILLAEGKWDTAWDEHELGFDCNSRIKREYGDIPEWDGSPGKTLIVYGEQGIGDEIMFASMLPDLLKTNDVILDCHKRLKTLFENSFGIPCHGTREDHQVTWTAKHRIDAKCSIGSLGKFYRRSKESFPGTPYLIANAAPKGPQFRVGISWTGGKKSGRVQKRSVPLSWWKTIFANDCEFVSLQYTDCSDEIRIVNEMGYTIKEFDAVKADDYNETAKLVKSCDLVISVCTSVVHLAGALGVPCWVMTPHAPAWRYGAAGPMPWYRSVRLYRQPAASEDAWRPVVQRVGFDLEELLHEKSKENAA